MTLFVIHYTFDRPAVIDNTLTATSGIGWDEPPCPVVKWRIRRSRITRMWVVTKPGRPAASFPTHRQAMAYVTQQIARTK